LGFYKKFCGQLRVGHRMSYLIYQVADIATYL